jgi:hypothetical protein
VSCASNASTLASPIKLTGIELPGKMRLDKQAYLAVQTIYYPGFNYGGLPPSPELVPGH